MPWLFQDAYNRANETPLASPWIKSPVVIGDFNLASNSVTPSSIPDDGGTQLPLTVRSWPLDMWCRAAITVNGTAGSNAGLGLRLRSDPTANTYYRAVMDHAASNNVSVSRFVAGASTTLAQATFAWTDGALMEFQAQGATLTVLVAGTVVISVVDTAPLTAAGAPGLAYSTLITSGSIDQFEAGDFLQQIGGMTHAQPANEPRVGPSPIED